MTDNAPHEFVQWINAVEARIYRLETERETFWGETAKMHQQIQDMKEVIAVLVANQSPQKTNGDHTPPPDDDPSPIVA